MLLSKSFQSCIVSVLIVHICRRARSDVFSSCSRARGRSHGRRRLMRMSAVVGGIIEHCSSLEWSAEGVASASETFPDGGKSRASALGRGRQAGACFIPPRRVHAFCWVALAHRWRFLPNPRRNRRRSYWQARHLKLTSPPSSQFKTSNQFVHLHHSSSHPAASFSLTLCSDRSLRDAQS